MSPKNFCSVLITSVVVGNCIKMNSIKWDKRDLKTVILWELSRIYNAEQLYLNLKSETFRDIYKLKAEI